MVNSQELNKTISELETQVKKFKNISEVYSEIVSLKSDLLKLKDQSILNSDRIKSISETIENKLYVYEKLIIELGKDNKIFQKELEQHITSKLEKHKSDIQVEIRNEGAQIQRSVELALKENIMNLEKTLSEKISKAKKQQSILSIIIIVLIIAVFFAMKFLKVE